MSSPLPPAVPATLDDLGRQFMEFGPDVMVLLRPDGRCRHVSSASLQVMGRPAAAFTGINLGELVLEGDRHMLTDLLAELGSGTSSATAAFRVYCAGGEVAWMEANARRLPAGAGIVMALRDISARKEEEAVLIEANDLLRRRATLDPVTCLPNRSHFVGVLERELRRASRDGTAVALIAIGVDDMRLFNDFYGRDAGDLALREVAAAIAGALCRPADVAGRMQGAMMGVVLPGTELAGASAVADRLRLAVAALRLEHAGTPSGHLSATVGLACSESRTKADTLLRDAACEVEVARAASAACVVTE